MLSEVENFVISTHLFLIFFEDVSYTLSDLMIILLCAFSQARAADCKFLLD